MKIISMLIMLLVSVMSKMANAALINSIADNGNEVIFME